MAVKVLITIVIGVIAVLTLACGGPSPSKPKPREGLILANSDAKPSELNRMLERVMASPQIRTEPGFAARVLVGPGEMYDPLFMRKHGDEVWINDDGGQEAQRGRQGYIWAVDRRGRVSAVVVPSRLWGPPIGFDIAPAGFGPYGGQIFTISQPEAGAPGVMKGHYVERVDPTTQ